jgi:RimJ/RimL family protein N-acetyltransferase
MIDIIPIQPSLVESFHRTLDTVAREKRYLAFLEAPPIEQTRKYVLDNIKQGHPQLVALAAGEVIGWCDVVPKPRPIYAHSGVLGIGLLPQMRAKGIGIRLIRQTLAAARSFGFSRIELTVRENNQAAIALYEKVGFETEGLMRQAARVDGAYENVALMALLFEAGTRQADPLSTP